MPKHIYFGNSKNRVTRAILHCAAVPTDWAKDKQVTDIRDTVRQWHKDRGFNDIGYHYVVDQFGHVAVGRPLNKMGAHTLSQNHDTLGILMIESIKIEHIGNFTDYFTERQRIAVGEILRYHEITDVSGHNQYANKLCPGFRVDFLPNNYFSRGHQLTWWQRIGALMCPFPHEKD